MRAVAVPVLFCWLVACADAPSASPEAPPEATVAPAPEAARAPAKEASCTWAADVAGASVGWTAFKFTDKTAVGGGFDTVRVAGGTDMDAPWKALDGLTFEIDTRSVNSNNPERDARIQAHFFDAMADGAVIRGRVKANSVGKSTLTITMNGTTQAVVVDVKQSGDGPLTLSGILDVQTWSARGAIEALNEVCDELHTGADGVSKLWSEVAISAEVPLKKTCG